MGRQQRVPVPAPRPEPPHPSSTVNSHPSSPSRPTASSRFPPLTLSRTNPATSQAPPFPSLSPKCPLASGTPPPSQTPQLRPPALALAHPLQALGKTAAGLGRVQLMPGAGGQRIWEPVRTRAVSGSHRSRVSRSIIPAHSSSSEKASPLQPSHRSLQSAHAQGNLPGGRGARDRAPQRHSTFGYTASRDTFPS